jgi:hypothetical protein
LAVAVAYLIYRPDRELPFHHLDFSEFLPVLQSSSSFLDGFSRLAEFYGRFGRANVIPYALLSAKWELFGWWSPGWQWSRFAVMVAILVLLFRLLRRLGASAPAAAAGCSLFLVAPPATRGWIQLTMAEPLGTLLLLALCLTVIPSEETPLSRARWAAAGLLILGVLLTKEMLVATFVLPLGLSLLTDEAGRLSTPALRRHVKQLVVLLVGVGVVAGAVLVRAILAAPSGAYYSAYGQFRRPTLETMAIWLATISPIDPAGDLPGAAKVAALCLFVVLVGGGGLLYVRRAPQAAANRWLLAVAAGFPLVGALAYMPWPTYVPFYAIPYLIGASILVALALTGIERSASRAVLAVAHASWGMLLVLAATQAQWEAESTAALQRLNYRLVTRIGADQSIDSVFFATGRIDSQRWRGPARTLGRYAAAVQVRWPPVRDVLCNDRGRAPGSVVIYRDGLCPSPADVEAVVERYQRFSLRRLTMVPESIWVDLRRGPPSS